MTREPARPDAPRLRRFHELYRGEFAFVWATAQHFGVPSGAVDDVVQDVFLTAYRRLEQLRFEVSPRAWLFGVTRRVAFRHRRGAARRVRRHEALAELARPAPQAPQQRHDDAELLRGLLARLGEGTRAVWEMTELLGMSAPEIASELALPLNTVYSRLRLARRQLAELADEERLGAWRGAARAEQAPPRGAEQRSWGLLLPVFGKASAGAGLAAWLPAPGAVATTLATVGAAAVGLVLLREPAPVAPASARAAAVERAPAAVAAVVRAPELPVVVEAPVTRPAASGVAPEGPRLTEEIALVDRAQAQLGAGELDAALRTVDEHARRFPAGALVDVREAARAELLCRAGDARAAEATARRLLQAHPGSAVAQRFVNYSCGGDGSPGAAETRG